MDIIKYNKIYCIHKFIVLFSKRNTGDGNGPG